MKFTYEDNLVSDLHKDARGIRPTRGFMLMWNDLTPAQRQETWDNLIDEMDQRDADERQVTKDNIKKFEDRIDDVIGLGAGDRETALRWIAGQEKFYHKQDIEHFVWELGIMSTQINWYSDNLIKELEKVVKYEECV